MAARRAGRDDAADRFDASPPAPRQVRHNQHVTLFRKERHVMATNSDSKSDPKHGPKSGPKAGAAGARPRGGSKQDKPTLTTVGKGPFRMRDPQAAAARAEPMVHLIRPGVRCGTERRGYETPEGRSPLRIVVDASNGFIPLWAEGVTLRWRFQERSMEYFEDPDAAADAIEQLFGEALLMWGDAMPVQFTRDDDLWDFEIVMSSTDDCDGGGCVLASAFFPDAGRHELWMYPKMFTQPYDEVVETFVHEVGHVFGLRHFFAQISEGRWPSEIFGRHRKFSIMNYGENSRLTEADRTDLRRLYDAAWSGDLTHINGTPIRLMQPYHAAGDPWWSVAAARAPRPAPLPPSATITGLSALRGGRIDLPFDGLRPGAPASYAGRSPLGLVQYT
jgi:hypothetical protein